MPDEEPKHKKTLICQGCGKEIEWRAKRKYCTKCSVKKHDVDRKNWIKKNRGKAKSDNKGMVLCKCPICGKLYKIKMNWTGRGIPRKNCINCATTETLQAGLHYNLNYLEVGIFNDCRIKKVLG